MGTHRAGRHINIVDLYAGDCPLGTFCGQFDFVEAGIAVGVAGLDVQVLSIGCGNCGSGAKRGLGVSIARTNAYRGITRQRFDHKGKGLPPLGRIKPDFAGHYRRIIPFIAGCSHTSTELLQGNTA